MANRWKGSFVVAASATSDGTAYTGKAHGTWNLSSQLQQNQAGLWAKGVGAPLAPTIGSASPAAASASVSFTAPSDNGGGSLTYTVVSSPGNKSGTGSSSPILVTGLTDGTAYTFTVTATNSLGYTSPSSSASNSASPSSDIIAIGTQLSPFINIYGWASGYGTKFANPASLPVTTGMTRGLCFNPTNTAIVATFTYGTAAPTLYTAAYPFSTTTGFGTQYTAPGTPPPNESMRCCFSPNGSYLAIPHSGTPFISVYNWSNGYGSKLTNPGTLPAGVLAYGCNFSPSSNALGVLSNTEGSVYSWSGGFGTKYAMTMGTPANGNIAFSPAGNQVAVSKTTTPYIQVFPWTGSSFGTVYSNPANVMVDYNYPAMVFSKANNYLMASDAIYNWTTSGFGSYIGSTGTPGILSHMPAFNSSATILAKGIDVFPITAGVLGSKYSGPSSTVPVDAAGYGSTCFTN